jgi:hypothetical protein
MWSCAFAAISNTGCAERLVMGIEVAAYEDGDGVASESATSSAPTDSPSSGALVFIDAGVDGAVEEPTQDDDETDEEQEESEDENEGESLSENSEHEGLPLEHEAAEGDDGPTDAQTGQDERAEPDELEVESTEVAL